jgi:hypothetical protein
MSFSFYLYRAPDAVGPMSQWEEMHASSLGSMDAVKVLIAGLYPQMVWERFQGRWQGVGLNGDDDPYLDVSLSEDEPGACMFVVLNKAPPSVMRNLMEALVLNHVYAPESGDMVDPYAYSDTDRYYAKK